MQATPQCRSLPLSPYPCNHTQGVAQLKLPLHPRVLLEERCLLSALITYLPLSLSPATSSSCSKGGNDIVLAPWQCYDNCARLRHQGLLLGTASVGVVTVTVRPLLYLGEILPAAFAEQESAAGHAACPFFVGAEPIIAGGSSRCGGRGVACNYKKVIAVVNCKGALTRQRW